MIAELYKKLDHAFWSTQDYISPYVATGAASEEERGHTASKATNEFIRYYYENKIFLPEDTCAVVETLIQEHKSILMDFALKDLEPTERMREWRRVNKKFESDVGELKRKLEVRFRGELGVKPLGAGKSTQNNTQP